MNGFLILLLLALGLPMNAMERPAGSEDGKTVECEVNVENASGYIESGTVTLDIARLTSSKADTTNLYATVAKLFENKKIVLVQKNYELDILTKSLKRPKNGTIEALAQDPNLVLWFTYKKQLTCS